MRFCRTERPRTQPPSVADIPQRPGLLSTRGTGPTPRLPGSAYVSLPTRAPPSWDEAIILTGAGTGPQPVRGSAICGRPDSEMRRAP